MTADRRDPSAYDAVRELDWDAVFDVSWQPGYVRSAVAALADRARHWTYVSSASVYASDVDRGADERAEVHEPTDADEAGIDLYGPAKVACELACQSAVGDRLLVARAGLIGGPGDGSDRTGAWVARAAAAPADPMLVPDSPDAATQVVDVRDMCTWLVDCAEAGTVGVFNTVGPEVSLDDWIELSRAVGGHTGDVVRADPSWLLAEGIAEWAGENSLAMWITDPENDGFARRSNAAATAAGLAHRSRESMVVDLLAWETERGLDRPRRAGLTRAKEAELLAALGSAGR